MKKSGKRVLCLVMIAALLAGLSGCTTFNNFKNAFFSDPGAATERTIKIGVYESITGANKAQGKEEVMGIELAYELYPTVLGKNVELIYADNKSDMYEAETAIQTLLTNDISVVLGSYGETITLVASDYIKMASVPAITISSTNPLITANNPYYFSATYTEARQGDALANFAYDTALKDSVATVKMANDDTATATIKRFTNRIKKVTGNNKSVAGNFTISADTTDFTETIEKLRSSGAKAVFLAISPAAAEKFLQQCMDNQYTHVLFLGTRAWNDEKFIKFASENSKIDIAFCAEEPAAIETELSKIFMRAYVSKYGEESKPSGRTAAAFDAYILALKGIEDAYSTLQNEDVEKYTAKAGSDGEAKAIREAWNEALEKGIPTGSQIKNAITAIKDFQGASGTINYNGSNEATKTITINYIDGAEDASVYVAAK
ncbi:MAG: ABC transporter substrate-binding protein [Firmicutes bacterium]|nr:ABC transporter substrate-binding protein [Bacillota bacterium]